MGDESAKILGEALKVNTRIMKLYLKKNSIRVEGAKFLNEAIYSNIVLKELDLNDSKIGAEGEVLLKKTNVKNKEIHMFY